MASRYEVEVIVTSAKNLKNVNWRHGKLRPYAVVWVDPKNKCSTRVDEDGDDDPQWDHKLTIPFDIPIDDATLYIDVVHAGADEDTKPLIGSAKLRLRDVGLGSRAEKKLELKRPSGRPHGKLTVDVSVREPMYRAPDPYYAPPYGVASRDYAPPAPAPYGNPYAAPPAYGAPPSGYPSYGAPPSGYAPYGAALMGYGQPSYGQGAYGQQGYVEGEKKSKFGGMGTGLAVGAVAGALGGLALAEGFDALEDKIADDVADRVEDDYGYDGDDF